MSFKDILRKAGPIYVSVGGDFGEQIGQAMLEPNKKDWEYINGPHYADGILMQGDGTMANPYTYLSPVPVSLHYAAVDLWSRSPQGSIIKVGTYLLKVTTQGVIAKDGTVTDLM
ncbi:MAG TPA: hypothetical protein P5080_02230 [Candidatus Paceibacterota bacterium]|nr:hypothetical protein [Candidatus Pacearchaeota archaeon]HRZ50787.1 hypothetical protein [Candidatus Paceibacterota bacterium]HSA36508.1 hypothetical protein [Candidatus Paceibacterota bacterium]